MDLPLLFAVINPLLLSFLFYKMDIIMSILPIPGCYEDCLKEIISGDIFINYKYPKYGWLPLLSSS